MLFLKGFDLILFDFDGLLVDTEPLHYRAYVELCARRGFALDWTLEQYCQAAHLKSMGMREALYRAFPALYDQEPNWEVLYLEKKEIYVRLLDEEKPRLMPGAQEVLSHVQEQGISHAVVTNSPLTQIEKIRSHFPVLQQIPLWLTREDYAQPKPSPEGYLKAIERMGGQRVIGFEDSLKGLQSLHAANALPVLICASSHPQLPACQKWLGHHFESLAILDFN